MKIRPVGAELFHAHRRTDMNKLMVAFSNSANTPKNRTFTGDYRSLNPDCAKRNRLEYFKKCVVSRK